MRARILQSYLSMEKRGGEGVSENTMKRERVKRQK